MIPMLSSYASPLRINQPMANPIEALQGMPTFSSRLLASPKFGIGNSLHDKASYFLGTFANRKSATPISAAELPNDIADVLENTTYRGFERPNAKHHKYKIYIYPEPLPQPVKGTQVYEEPPTVERQVRIEVLEKRTDGFEKASRSDSYEKSTAKHPKPVPPPKQKYTFSITGTSKVKIKGSDYKLKHKTNDHKGKPAGALAHILKNVTWGLVSKATGAKKQVKEMEKQGFEVIPPKGNKSQEKKVDAQA